MGLTRLITERQRQMSHRDWAKALAELLQGNLQLRQDETGKETLVRLASFANLVEREAEKQNLGAMPTTNEVAAALLGIGDIDLEWATTDVGRQDVARKVINTIIAVRAPVL
jgi:hypothetical protein